MTRSFKAARKIVNKYRLMKRKSVMFCGHKIWYSSWADLAKTLRTDLETAREIVRSRFVNRYISDENGNIARFDVKKKPIVFRDFNVDVPANSVLMAKGVTVLRASNNKTVAISDVVAPGARFMVSIVICFDASSDENEIRTLEGSEVVGAVNVLAEVRRRVQDFKDVVPDMRYPTNDKEAYRVHGRKGWSRDPEPLSDVFYMFRIASTFNSQPFSYLENGFVRERRAPNIGNLVGNLADFQMEDDNNCAIAAINTLSSRYRKISSKTINKLVVDDCVPLKNLHEFLTKYRIPQIWYNSARQVIHHAIPEVPSKSYRGFYAIIANNHVYLLNGKDFKPRSYDKVNSVVLCNTMNKLHEHIETLLNAGTIPAVGNFTGSQLVSVCNTTDKGIDKYIFNPDYQECRQVMESFGLHHLLKASRYDNVSFTSVFNLVAKMYDGKTSSRSFWPYMPDLHKVGFLYDVGCKDGSGLATIDKNKCYSNVLERLPYLIKVDIATCVRRAVPENTTRFTDHYLYTVSVDVSSILLPSSSVYTGYHLKYCLFVGLKFRVHEELSTYMVRNVYKQFVKDLYDRVPESVAKKVVNCGIGSMMGKEHVVDRSVRSTIVSQADSVFYTAHVGAVLPKNYRLVSENRSYLTGLYNRRPIFIQIHDGARMDLYKKMVELGLEQDDVVQIHTDSITYKGALPSNLDAKDRNGWKAGHFKPIVDKGVLNRECLFTSIVECNNNVLRLGYAGCGKTHHIINELIPTLTNYLVLTPSHIASLKYKQAGLRCEVIQKYGFGHIDVDYNVHTVIVDEIGMVCRKGWDVLVKCKRMYCRIHAFGDFQQLAPVGAARPYSSQHFLDYMFGIQERSLENWRNNFTIEYYESLIGSKDAQYLADEVHKWSARRPEDAQVVICWRNKVVDRYNAVMMAHHGFKNIHDIGVTVICRTNEYAEYGMFNNFTATVVLHKNGMISVGPYDEYDGVVLSSGLNLSIQELKAGFKPAYARTVYGVQGLSIDSYYFAPEDDDRFNKSGAGNVAYTIISRLAQKK